MYQATEDMDIVQQRGGWTDRKVMRIYLQELVSTVYFSTLSPLVRGRVETYASVSAAGWERTFSSVERGATARDIPDLWYAELVPRHSRS